LPRALQGFGGGLAQPLSAAMLFMTFAPKEQGLAFGLFRVAIIVAPALGPILGGLLVDQDLWRWIFFINVPIGLVGITLAAVLLRPQAEQRRPRLSPLSVVTAVVGFGSVLYAASIAATDGWTSGKVLGFFALGSVSLLIFTIVELWFAPEPLLELRLFKQRTFLIANLVGYVAVIALFGAEFLMPVYLQALRGRTALQSGVILLPLRSLRVS
jgi:EmrB/QacA subfamily drug resistance transporter